MALSPDGTRAGVPARRRLVDRGRAAAAPQPDAADDTSASRASARVPLGTYNRADARSGHRRVGRRLAAIRLVARRADASRSTPSIAGTCASVPFPSYLGAETVVSELRRGYPGDENERRTLALLASTRDRSQMIAARGARAAARDQRLPVVADRAGCWSIRCPTPAPSDGSTSSSPARRRRGWCGTIVATRASIPPTSRAGTRDGRRIVVVADLGERDQLYVIDPDVADAGAGARSRPALGRGGRARRRHRAGGRRRRPCSSPAPAKSPYERTSIAWPRATPRPWRITSHAGVHVPVGVARRAITSRRSGPTTSRRRSCWCGDARPGAAERRVTTSPPAGVRGATRGSGRATRRSRTRRRLRRARAHSRAGGARSHEAAPGDLRPGATRTPCATAGAGSPARCSSTSSSRATSSCRWTCAGSVGYGRALPRGVPDGLRRQGPRRPAGGRRRPEGAAVRGRPAAWASGAAATAGC